MTRFVIVVHAVKEVTGIAAMSQVHLRVTYCQTTLRTRSHKLSGGRITFNETFSFVEKPGKTSNIVQLQMRVDTFMSKSNKVGDAVVPLEATIMGQKIDREFAFEPKGGFVHISVEREAHENPKLVDLQQLNTQGSGVGGLGGLGGGGGGVGRRPTEEELEKQQARAVATQRHREPTAVTRAAAAAAEASEKEAQQAKKAAGKIHMDESGQRVYVPQSSFEPSAVGGGLPGGLTTAALHKHTASIARAGPQSPNHHHVHGSASGARAVTEGTQTERALLLTREEIDALYDFSPTPTTAGGGGAGKGAVQHAMTPRAERGRGGGSPTQTPNRAPAPTPVAAAAAAAAAAPSPVAVDGGPEAARAQEAPQRTATGGKALREAGDFPGLRALRAGAVGWPTDEVESLVMYARFLEAKCDAAERSLATHHITIARRSAASLATLADTYTRRQKSADNRIGAIVEREEERFAQREQLRAALDVDEQSPQPAPQRRRFTASDIAHMYAHYDDL